MDASLGTETRKRGRPRLPTPERRQHMLASKAKWREQNREYYLQQKRQLASRPEYLARRRELRAQATHRLDDDAMSDKGLSILDVSLGVMSSQRSDIEAPALSTMAWTWPLC